jgi:hypothetical protein
MDGILVIFLGKKSKGIRGLKELLIMRNPQIFHNLMNLDTFLKVRVAKIDDIS